MSEEGPRLLFCAFAEVPGATSAGTRVPQLVTAFSDEFDVDAMTLQGHELSHIQRMGTARVLRVPTEDKTFQERLASYRRALQRQISGDRYDFVYCADLFAAQVCAAFQEVQGFALVIEVTDVPSESFERRWPVDPADERLRAEWKQGESQALRQATHVIAASRYAARALAKRVDPRRVQLFRRAVDRTVFAPPTIEIADETSQKVAVLAREGGPRLAPTVAIVSALAEGLPSSVRLEALGQPPPEGEDALRGALAASGLSDRVKLVDVDTHMRMANALSDVDVVIVPSAAEAGADVYAVPHRALEAMACRRATVVTGPVDRFRDTLVPGEEAMVVEAQQPAAVVEATQKLLDAPALRDAMAGAGLRRMEQEADLVARTEELATFISETIGVTMTPRVAEATEPSDDMDATGISAPAAAPRPPLPNAKETLPPSPIPTLDSGRLRAAEIVVGTEASRVPSRDVSTPFERAESQLTEVHDAPESIGSSGAFTDEEALAAPLAPAAPSTPAAADRAESSVEGTPASTSVSSSLTAMDTIVAPTPGLDKLRLELVPGLDSLDEPATSLGDDWAGDTRIESERDFPEATPADAASTRPPVESEKATVSASDLEALPMRSLQASERTEAGQSPLEGADPWAHDTIADAGPVFTDERSDPRPAPGKTSSAGARNFLVDPEAGAHEATNPALDDETMDEMSLPRDTSSEG